MTPPMIVCEFCGTVKARRRRGGKLHRFCSPRCQARAARRRYRAGGLCIYCQKPAPPGQAACESCRQARNHAARERYATATLAGLCGVCQRRPVAAGTLSMCPACQWKNQVRMRRRVERAAQDGICTYCGKPATRIGSRYLSTCTACRKAKNGQARYAYTKIIEAGVCGICRQRPLARGSKSMCAPCLARNQAKTARYRELPEAAAG